MASRQEEFMRANIRWKQAARDFGNAVNTYLPGDPILIRARQRYEDACREFERTKEALRHPSDN